MAVPCVASPPVSAAFVVVSWSLILLLYLWLSMLLLLLLILKLLRSLKTLSFNCSHRPSTSDLRLSLENLTFLIHDLGYRCWWGSAVVFFDVVAVAAITLELSENEREKEREMESVNLRIKRTFWRTRFLSVPFPHLFNLQKYKNLTVSVVVVGR